MSNELKENTVPHTLCIPLCGRMYVQLDNAKISHEFYAPCGV